MVDPKNPEPRKPLDPTPPVKGPQSPTPRPPNNPEEGNIGGRRPE